MLKVVKFVIMSHCSENIEIPWCYLSISVITASMYPLQRHSQLARSGQGGFRHHLSVPKNFFSMSMRSLGITSTRLSACRCEHEILRDKIGFITKTTIKLIPSE